MKTIQIRPGCFECFDDYIRVCAPTPEEAQQKFKEIKEIVARHAPLEYITSDYAGTN